MHHLLSSTSSPNAGDDPLLNTPVYSACCTFTLFHVIPKDSICPKLFDQDAEKTNKADYEKLIAAKAQGAAFAHFFPTTFERSDAASDGFLSNLGMLPLVTVTLQDSSILSPSRISLPLPPPQKKRTCDWIPTQKNKPSYICNTVTVLLLMVQKS